MDERWKVMVQSRSNMEISLIKAFLESHEIPCLLLNQMDSAYQSFGEITLFVDKTHWLKAKHLLNQNE